jgi:hypothetical protein
MAGVSHQVGHLVMPAFFAHLADMPPMSCRVFTFGFHGF